MDMYDLSRLRKENIPVIYKFIRGVDSKALRALSAIQSVAYVAGVKVMESNFDAIREALEERDNVSFPKIGAMVAANFSGDVYIGWSMCNPIDIFNEKWALTLAIRKAVGCSKQQVPKKIQVEYNKFIERSRRYFKDAKAFHIAERKE